MLSRIARFSSVFVLGWWVLVSCSYSQYSEVECFRESGIAGSVLSVLSDSRGYLWAGTEDGLVLHFGAGQKVYQWQANDSTSLGFNHVQKVFEDDAGFLWVGTHGGGVCRMDPSTEKFRNYRETEGMIVYSIAQDSSGVVWFVTDRGLLRWLQDVDSISKVTVRAPVGDTYYFSVFKAKSGQMWLAGINGVYRFDPRTLVVDRVDVVSSDGMDAWTLCEDSFGGLWIGTFGGGLFWYDPLNNYHAMYRHVAGDVSSLGSDKVFTIYESIEKELWIGTWGGGLSKFDRRCRRFTSFRHIPEDSRSLTSDFVYSITEDESGRLWVGTFGGGLSEVRTRRRFQVFDNGVRSRYRLSGPNVFGIIEGRDESLWVANFGSGIDHFESHTGRHVQYTTTRGLPSNNVYSLWEDGDGTIWAGTDLGLSRKVGNVFTTVPTVDQTPLNVLCILRDRAGVLWLGTYRNNLNVLNRSRGRVEQVSKDNYRDPNYKFGNVLCLFEDRDSVLWIGTQSGLYLMDPRRMQLISWSHFSGDSNLTGPINGIMESREGILWLATREGLVALNTRSKRLQTWTARNGMSNNSVNCVMQDKSGILWVSTNRGLSRVVVEDKRDSLHLVFRNYFTTDGLPDNEFNWNACFSSATGMYFGGPKGVVYFVPSEIQDSRFQPRVVLTGIRKFNESIPVPWGLGVPTELVFPYSDRFITFEYSALDFSAPKAIAYEYRLEGFDDTWIRAENRTSVSYTNLSGGQYKFHVRATNSDGVWSDRTLTVAVLVEPPFWQALWFFVSSICAIIGIGYLVASYRYRQMLKLEKLRLKIAEDLHDSIGAGLTRVAVLVSIIENRLEETTRIALGDYLRSVRSASETVIRDMTDIVWFVNPYFDSLEDMVLRLRDQFEHDLSLVGISLQIDDSALHTFQKTRVSLIKRQNIHLILKEAVTNCVKHSKATTIAVAVTCFGKKVRIELEDNGQGFNTEAQTQGNGLLNMRRRANNIGWTLSIDSSATGTRIVLEGRL